MDESDYQQDEDMNDECVEENNKDNSQNIQLQIQLEQMDEPAEIKYIQTVVHQDLSNHNEGINVQHEECESNPFRK